MKDRIPEPLFDSAGNVQTDLARRRCGTLARAVQAGVAAAEHVAAARERCFDLEPALSEDLSLALDALSSWAARERERWHL